MTKYASNRRMELICLWRQARSEGQAQQDFCKTQDLSSRTLRNWIAAEETPRVSARQAEIVLRRMARSLLEAAEELSSAPKAETDPEIAAVLGESMPAGTASPEEAKPVAHASSGSSGYTPPCVPRLEATAEMPKRRGKGLLDFD